MPSLKLQDLPRNLGALALSTKEDEHSGLRVEVREGRIHRRGKSKDALGCCASQKHDSYTALLSLPHSASSKDPGTALLTECLRCAGH